MLTTGDLLSHAPIFKIVEISLYIFVLENSRETPGIGRVFLHLWEQLSWVIKVDISFWTIFQDEVFINSHLWESLPSNGKKMVNSRAIKMDGILRNLPSFFFSAKWAIQALNLLKFPRLFQGSILGQSLPAVCSLCLLLPLSWGTAPPSGPPACGGWGIGRRTELFLPLTCVTQWKEQKDYISIHAFVSTYRHP